ncbi:DUF4198 domain-containing protein [Aliarcobacter butzleri]|uniref:DUF4198 domain-containing protein n=1 Tax=Aliarcobacter butzleri TaxID=28197 RepID=A0AAW6VQI1_9BACT|nr:DUF4198 domain-containing protein [Aliarcobacter butzleri]MCG3679218.1 DUF4198 domain-containing protein [Aliarcobacter butzleri]MCT7602417.1 DUF4198 domain-containing protein [Aliarcobacter butzleri]MCT7605915.1 DUF4198 domain-containing protein [Aliarcobacter butzleri]MCT7608082.1 DUF4198 domain-containing protein [Aliarcobacter butzleri]MDK2062569.1 DUF4198 domain-containing protein [Aliarcobacter butzleri]
MKKLVYIMMSLSVIVLGANAHEVWLKLDDKKNEAQLFFGHFADNQKESGEKFERIKEGVTYPKDLIKEIKRNNDNITYTLSKKSDIVVVQESEPRKNRDTGITTKRIAYIKAGRTTTEVITAFDIVPIEKNSNTFKLVYNNQGVKKSEIKVVSPTGWEKTFMTDDNGDFTIITPWKGSYLIQAKYEDETKGEVDGKAYDKTVHVMTYTIENNQGLSWEIKK